MIPISLILHIASNTLNEEHMTFHDSFKVQRSFLLATASNLSLTWLKVPTYSTLVTPSGHIKNHQLCFYFILKSQLLFFQLTICCENQLFRIVVNGMQMHSFKHRFSPLQNIIILEIEGDLSLTSVLV